MYIHVFRKKKSNSHAKKKPPPVKPYVSQKSTQHQSVHYEAVKDAVVVPGKGLYVPFTCTRMYMYTCIYFCILRRLCVQISSLDIRMHILLFFCGPTYMYTTVLFLRLAMRKALSIEYEVYYQQPSHTNRIIHVFTYHLMLAFCKS